MKHKRSILIILSLFFALTLYGCSSTTDDDGQNNDPQDQQNQDEPQDKVDLEAAFSNITFPSNLSYEMEFTTNDETSYSTKLWLMEDKMKMETEAEGFVYITIFDGKNTYTLDPSTMVAMKFPEGDDAIDDDPIEDQVELNEFVGEDDWGSLDFIEEDTLNGIKTYVVTDPYAEDGMEYKMWIHQEYGIALRVESSGPNAEDNFVLEITNLEVGQVTDADFEIPEGYEVMEFGF